VRHPGPEVKSVVGHIVRGGVRGACRAERCSGEVITLSINSFKDNSSSDEKRIRISRLAFHIHLATRGALT